MKENFNCMNVQMYTNFSDSKLIIYGTYLIEERNAFPLWGTYF